MKKTFLVRRNALFSAGIPWGPFAFFLLFVVLLIRFLAPNFFWRAFTPIFNIADNLSEGVHSFISGFENTVTLVEQNERLINENTVLANENKALLQKSKDLSSLDKSGILAGVVARPPESPYDTFVLSAGENAGVILGMEAFGEGGVPIGTVSSVFADFSRVTLFSAPGITVGSWIGNNKIPVSLQGAGAGSFNASVPRASGIVIGDNVFVPGPGALPIGKVVRIDDNPSLPLSSLRIAPILNIFSITWVILRDIGAATP